MSDEPKLPLAYEANGDISASLTVALGFVGLRLLGVYFIVASVADIPQALAYLGLLEAQGSSPTDLRLRLLNVAYHAGPVVIRTVGGAYLFAKAHPLAIRLFGRARFAGGAISAVQAAALLIAGVGLFTIAIGLPRLASVLFTTLSQPASRRYAGLLEGDTWLFNGGGANLIAAVAHPLIGVALVVKCHALARFGLRKLDRGEA